MVSRRRRGRSVLIVTAVLVPAVLTAAALAPTAPAHERGYGMVRNILPPGSRGNVNAAELAELGVTNLPDLIADPSEPLDPLTTATPSTPRHFADWLGPYDALNTIPPRQIDAADVRRYFKDAGLHPTRVVHKTRLRGGDLVIKRGPEGVPFVYGQTLAGTAFGAGYAGIMDRMFVTDVLRHAGKARLSEFLGATPENIAMDRAQLRTAAYTEAQARAQIDRLVRRAERLADRFPRLARRFDDVGAAVRSWLEAFVAGMNAAQRRLCPVAFGLPALPDTGIGLGRDCPVEYALLQKQPQPYEPSDIVYIASLVGGIFGKGGGHEFENAIWLQRLTSRFGQRTGRAIYDDLREKNDPEAPTTATTPFPYGGSDPVNPNKPGVALPDIGGPTAPGTGALLGGDALPFDLPVPSELPLRSGGAGMSNALLVDAEHSANGHPVAVFGPQTGYFAPQLLTEIALHGPGLNARGVAFAGTQIFVQLGRGIDYAWSATSATGDIVDTVMERLCEPDGSAPTVTSTHYIGPDGTCVPMRRRVHTEIAVPTLAGAAAPRTLEFLVLSTRHGIVQQRTTVDGQPVAVVKQRSTYGHELDSALGFFLFNSPWFVRDAADFQRAASAVDFTFNWFYVDDSDIAYFSSGLLPVRAPGVEPDLPRWGAPRFDWRGWLAPDRHPQQVNPPTGYLVSWNNKAAPGHASADGEWGEGSVYRSQALSTRIERLFHTPGGVTPASLTGAMMGAATVDVRAAALLPELLAVLGRPDDPPLRAAIDVLRAWLADGAHRVDRDRNGHYAHEAAIALFDEWWASQTTDPVGKFALAKAVLRGTLGDLVDGLPQPLDDHPRTGGGSAWNGIAWYGYVDKDLRRILDRRVDGAYSRAYCGGGSLARCRADLRASLAAAVDRILAAQDVSSIAELTYDTSIDAITSKATGVVGVRPIDWQNRPTFQQVVSFTSGRPPG